MRAYPVVSPNSQHEEGLPKNRTISAASASVVKSTYGIELAGKDDRNVALMESVLQSAQAFAPGRFLVQYLPVLAYVPYWTPVAGPQLRELDRWRGDAYEVKQALFDISKSSMVSDTYCATRRPVRSQAISCMFDDL